MSYVYHGGMYCLRQQTSPPPTPTSDEPFFLNSHHTFKLNLNKEYLQDFPVSKAI